MRRGSGSLHGWLERRMPKLHLSNIDKLIGKEGAKANQNYSTIL